MSKCDLTYKINCAIVIVFIRINISRYKVQFYVLVII